MIQFEYDFRYKTAYKNKTVLLLQSDIRQHFFHEHAQAQHARNHVRDGRRHDGRIHGRKRRERERENNAGTVRTHKTEPYAQNSFHAENDVQYTERRIRMPQSPVENRKHIFRERIDGNVSSVGSIARQLQRHIDFQRYVQFPASHKQFTGNAETRFFRTAVRTRIFFEYKPASYKSDALRTNQIAIQRGKYLYKQSGHVHAEKHAQKHKFARHKQCYGLQCRLSRKDFQETLLRDGKQKIKRIPNTESKTHAQRFFLAYKRHRENGRLFEYAIFYKQFQGNHGAYSERIQAQRTARI